MKAETQSDESTPTLSNHFHRAGHTARQCRQPKEYRPQVPTNYIHKQPQSRHAMVMRMQQRFRGPAFNVADYTPSTPEAQAYAAGSRLTRDTVLPEPDPTKARCIANPGKGVSNKTIAPGLVQQHYNRTLQTCSALPDSPYGRDTSAYVLHEEENSWL